MPHVVKCKLLSLCPLHIFYKINLVFEQLFLYIHFCHYLNSCVYALRGQFWFYSNKITIGRETN